MAALLFYNYFRDYDASTGRYIQSDPIGLAGGHNTYGYVGQTPLGAFDFLGLQATDPVQRHMIAHATRGNYSEAIHTLPDLRIPAKVLRLIHVMRIAVP